MKPNILLITADQWRGDCLSAADHPHVSTPHLDALATEGVRFARHFANAAPCSPARACLYTGLYQMNNRVCMNGTPLDKRHDNLALAAQRAGYQPRLFGYTDTAADPRGLEANDPRLRTYEGLLPGFSSNVELTDDEIPWKNWLCAQGTPNALDTNVHVPASGVDDPPTGAPPQYNASQTPTVYLVDQFNEWLAAHAQSAPSSWLASVCSVYR